MIFTEYACPRKKYYVEQTSHLRFAFLRRTNDLSDDIKETLIERFKSCAAFSQALDVSTEICDTTQFGILIRAVYIGFDVGEVFLDMAILSSTTTRQDICEHVIRVVEYFVRCA